MLNNRNKMSSEQQIAWNSILLQAFDLVSQSDRDDPILFHGTTAIASAHILRDGFAPTYSFGATKEEMPKFFGVHWGHPAIASSFAMRYVDYDNPPVLFCARASDIARSTPDNKIRPDYFACMDAGCPKMYPEGFDESNINNYNFSKSYNMEKNTRPSNWQESLVYSGAIVAMDGRNVPNLCMMNLPDGLKLLPEAMESRRARLQKVRQMPLLQSKNHALMSRATGNIKIPKGMEGSVNPINAHGIRIPLTVEELSGISTKSDKSSLWKRILPIR